MAIQITPSIAQSKVKAKLQTEREAHGAFKAKLTVSGLEKDHQYVVTLNGFPKHDSNKYLEDECRNVTPQGEAYCDFGEFTPNEEGPKDIDLEKELPKGKYQVKFFIKDKSSKHTIVWQREELVNFEVK